MTGRNIRRARTLRVNQTDAERRLWSHLRNRAFFGFKFRRQVPIGPYIADFLCMERMLIIELDGGQHDERAQADARRTSYLQTKGYRVMRFWNNDMLANTDGVLTLILTALREDPHPPTA